MEGFDFTAFQQAMGDRNWPIVAAFVILVVVRVAKFPIFGNYWEKVPKEFRPWVPVLLGVLSGLGEALMSGRSWVPALLFGVLSGLMAVGADQAITKPLKKLSKPKAGEKE